MRTIAIANHKGGVGKTTTALNLGYALAELGQRVLLLDLDPQASLSLATVGDCSGRSLAEVLKTGGLGLRDIARPLRPGLDLAPSDLALSVAELGLSSSMKATALKKALVILSGYDLALLDCPPSLGALVVNALVAAQAVIVPTLPSALDLRGVKIFLGSLDDIRELNPGLHLLGVLVCQYVPRMTIHQQALEALQAAGLPILGTIARSVQAVKTAGAGEALNTGPLAEQYKTIACEVEKWLKRQTP